MQVPLETNFFSQLPTFQQSSLLNSSTLPRFNKASDGFLVRTHLTVQVSLCKERRLLSPPSSHGKPTERWPARGLLAETVR